MVPLLVTFDERVEHGAQLAATLIEALGIVVIILGAAGALSLFFMRVVRRHAFGPIFGQLRRNLGRAILLGLEFLVAADIIGTVLIQPTFYNLGVLALLVAIRTFLSMTLSVEVEGRWPWQAAEAPSG